MSAKAAEAPCAAGCKSTAGVWAARGRASAKNEVGPKYKRTWDLKSASSRHTGAERYLPSG